jgi:dTDP-4-amino-4,6-dideoxygalactose transaminase
MATADLKPDTTRQSIALLGGEPAFREALHVGRPNLGDRGRFLSRVTDMLDRHWLTNDGPLVREFEAKVAGIVGAKHCIAMCNATVALEIAIRALELKGEVILPSYTFVATAHALQWQEITPVFADINPHTLNIDPAAIERLITPRTTAILGVHVWGRPCDTSAIQKIAEQRGLVAMYDAAHAFGCSHDGRMIGTFGACEIFSFHATKFVNSFEGGAVVTNDDALAFKMRLMRNFGFAGYDRVVYLGTNGKMTEICAAMGLTSLETMEDIVTINRQNYEAYRDGLRGLPGVSLIDFDPTERQNYQYVVVEVDPDLARLNRDELVEVLHADNVLARKYFWPGCHRMEPYRSFQPHAALLLPETERLASRIIVLPNGQAVTPHTVATVCGIIQSACAQAEMVRKLLPRARLSFGESADVE